MATLTEIVKGMEKGADALQGNFESLSNQVNSLATSTYTKTAVNGLLDPIVNGNTIVSGTDLNTVLTPGKYYVAQDDISATLKNSPTKVAFTMTVKKHAGVLQEITEYFPNASARKFYRSINEGIVGPWNRIAVTDQDSSIAATWNFTNGFTGGMKAKPWAGPGDTIKALITTGLLAHTGMWYIGNSSVAPTDLSTYIPFASTNFSLIVEPTANNSGRLGVILWDSKQQYSAIVTSGVIGEWVNYKTDLSAYAKTADVNSLISESITNISVGGRNYILDTSNPKTQTSYGIDNQDLRNSATFYSPIKNWGIANGDYIISFDWTLKTALSSDMQASIFFDENPYQQQFFTVKSGQLVGHVDLKFKLDPGILTAAPDVTGLIFRIMSQMASGNTITYSDLFMKSGTINTTWTPAPEDQATKTEVTTLAGQVQGGGINLLINTSSSSTNGQTMLQGAGTDIYGVYSRTDSYEQVTASISGAFSYRFMSPDTNKLYGLTPGETYTLSGSASYTSGKLEFKWGYTTSGANWSEYSSDLGIPVSDGTVFTPFSHTFTIPVGFTGVYFSLWGSEFTANSIFRFKNMKLEKGSLATPWSANPCEILTQSDYAKIKAAIVALGGTLS